MTTKTRTTTKYVAIDHDIANEVSVTTSDGAVASLIFFTGIGKKRGATGQRASKVVVAEFNEYAIEYDACVIYVGVPTHKVESFIDIHTVNGASA